MRSACASRNLVSRGILELGPGLAADADASGRAPAKATDIDIDMMVYPDPQWTCSATAPMLQLYDDVGYRGKYLIKISAMTLSLYSPIRSKRTKQKLQFISCSCDLCSCFIVGTVCP